MTLAWAYGLLAVAIALEIVATTALKASEGMTRLGPGIVVVLGYVATFALLAFCLRILPVGLVYAIWAGVGVIGVALSGALLFGETFTAVKILGMALIVAGVVLVKSSGA